ncbi:MAG: SPOR domain-containing protein [Woeseiaceae bacterium]|jgi:DedD protein|nr:SPOR domain-containing protein [Woeseiaceae bacterium]
MERALKERIIGAIVLVAVAVLVVPVFLDGPVDESAVVSERISLPGQGGDDGMRTVVLDRDRSEPVPATPLPARQSEPEPTVTEPPPRQASLPEPVPNPPPEAEPEARSAPETLPEPAVSSPESAPESEPATRSTTGMWAVQLGSFSNEANAERLAADLRQQGFAAFLSKLTTDQGELHRVRVGPQRDREAAETMLARLERAGQKGQVVPHP